MIRLRFHKTFFLVLLVVGCILFSIFAGIAVRSALRTSTIKSQESSKKCILIDPGHGGMDGGTISVDGTVEKDINLAVSLPLADMLRLFGYNITMSRDGDYDLCDSGNTVREKKISDMNNRLKLYNQSYLVISVHQNYFTESQYWGAQIFYSLNNTESLELAKSVRQSIVDMTQPTNKRELKKATSDIYLLHSTTVPAIIVECGFMSNSDELAKLKCPEYQEKMAFAIACGVLAYGP